MNVNFTTNICKVTFNPNQENSNIPQTRYSFKVPPSLIGNLHVGDLVVVHCKNGFQLARVHEVNCYKDTKASDYIISVVDTEEYENMKMREEEKLRVKAALDAKYASYQKSKIYEMMAADDAEAANLLKRFKELGGE